MKASFGKITDALTWQAVYNDGSDLWECNPEGHIINRYKDIDRSRLTEFRVYLTEDLSVSEPKLFLRVAIKEGYRLIWRKRRLQRLLEDKPFATIYLIGWQTTLEGKNIQSILYLYPDGTDEPASRFIFELNDSKSNLELFDFEHLCCQMNRQVGSSRIS